MSESTNSIDADPASWLSTVLLPVLDYRVSLLGLEESGAYDFYQARLSCRRIFADYELELAKGIVANQLPVDEIHEIGCGWGQLPILLAWCGYRTTGFEIDRRRFVGASCLLSVLQQIDPARAARVTLRREFFPPLDRPQRDRSLVIATNIVTENPKYVEEQILRGVRRYGLALFDIDRFCTLRKPHEREVFLAHLKQSGLRSRGLFFDAGRQGHFYLFEPN
jgi:hypothetical protein